MLEWIGSLGRVTLAFAGWLCYLTAAVVMVLAVSVRRSTWTRTVRDVFARQVLFTGVEALGFMALAAVMVGILVVVQVQYWLVRVGQTQYIGPVLVVVVIRELGPLVVNFIVIGRSGNAMAMELALMKTSGELRVLDAQGLDPFIYLVVPRVLALTVSIFCLTLVFAVISLASGYLCAGWVGARTGGTVLYVNSVTSALDAIDVINVVAKTLIPGLLSGTICCIEGLNVEGGSTEIPQATTRGLQRSMLALCATAAIVSLLTYT